MATELIEQMDVQLALMMRKLATLQNPDGGFKGFYCHDTVSGVWSTAEIVHMAATVGPIGDDKWLRSGCEYIAMWQNEDGGWPFRAKGKSITDITAWCCLALSHFGHHERIAKGIDFILRARANEGSEKEDGWGLTTFESDRVYSTWIASYCLSRLVRTNGGQMPPSILDEIRIALSESKEWILRAQNPDGSWGAAPGSAPHYSSTAAALLTAFLQGDNPVNFRRSYEFLLSGLRNGLWNPENEIVVTKEGYELTQQWFTSALCFRVMVFFAELGVASIDELDQIFRRLLDLICQDGGVALAPEATADMVWTIPFMLDALGKYKAFVASKPREFRAFLERKQESVIQSKRRSMEEKLQRQFPYPISHAFFTYQHELDYHRKFQLGLQLYEVGIKYAAVVGLSGYLLARERNDHVNSFLIANFRRPSLGDWCTLLEMLLNESQGFGSLLHPFASQDVLKSRRNYLDESVGKINLNQALSGIVALRNSSTGHGALQTLYEYKLMLEDEESSLYSFFDRMAFLASSNSFLVLTAQYDEFGEGDKYKIRVFRGLQISDSDLETNNRLSEGQKDTMVRYIYFQNTLNNTIVNLYPFLSYMFCENCKREHFFFYNGTKGKDQALYLSYECGHSLERGNGVHLQKRFQASGIEWGTASASAT